jgi:3-oxoacyl-[acyl-carrier protein] reductase
MATQAARVAIVTGSARGIGRACAHVFAQRGYAMALVDVLLPEMTRTRAEIEKMNRPCLSYQADVALHGRAREVVDDVIQRWGRVDVLVNDAGNAQPKGITELSEAEWNATIDLNLKSCFNWIQPIVPHMQAARYGRIISMSSLNTHSGGVTAAVSRFAYAAAKAGIIGMTRSLAKELGPDILVNCVCPGLIKTEVAGNAVIRDREHESLSALEVSQIAIRGNPG